MAHVKNHTAKMDFACPHPGCTKQFNLRYKMRRHMKLHSGIKYACDVCQKQFNSTKSVREHKSLYNNFSIFVFDYLRKSS